MRIKTRFVMDISKEQDVHQVYSLAKLPVPQKRKTRLTVVELFNDTIEYSCVRIFMAQHPQYACFMTEDEVFSEEELLQAPLMRMVPNAHRGGYPQPEGGKRHENFLSKSYDLSSGCPYCTKGLLQNRPLRLRGSISLGKKNDISGIQWLREYVITRRLKELLEASDLTGFEVWPIISHGKNAPFDNYFQLKITGELPPMTPLTQIEYKPKRTSRFDAPCDCGMLRLQSRETYYAKDIVDIPDFALTREWFGRNDEFWRWPYMSQKAYRLFKENKITGIRYYPPEIID